MRFLFPWKRRDGAGQTASHTASSRRSTRLGMETMEARCLLSVTPINVGAVYIERDIGTDSTGDTFQISFDGGVENTELQRVTIDGDQQIRGFGVGDVFFDTSPAGLGADHAFAFQVVNDQGIGHVSATVADGGTALVLDMDGFHAGDILEFSIDVDEVEDFDPQEDDLQVLNDSFDPITSGVEFQGSTLTAEFAAPHFFNATGSAEFRNRYDDALIESGLGLPEDNAGGQRDRSAGAFLSVTQQPIPVDLSGYVYHDRDDDGNREGGEEGIADVEVRIVPIETIVPQSAVSVFTDADGFYQSPRLAPGTYRVVEVDQPVPFLDGRDSVGRVDGALNGRLVPGGDAFTQIQLRGGQSGVEYNFGEVLPVNIRGRVQLSTREGDCFGGEEEHQPVVGATVHLLDADGAVIDTTVTDENGEYEFSNLRPGTYGVREITPDELIDGGARPGTIEGEDTGQVVDSNTVTNIVALSGQTVEDVDFCEHAPAGLEGTVYHDRDDDGRQSRGEEGIGNVLVRLLDSDGNEVARQRTNRHGDYRFDGLHAGTYTVVESQPNAWLDGKDRAGTVGGLQVGTASNDRIQGVNLLWGDHGIDYDFGELLPIAIQGRVQLSTREGDCFGEDEDHEPVVGATVELLDSDGKVIETTVTDANGEYQFTGLRPGTYSVREITPVDLIDGGASAGHVDGRATGDPTSGVVTNIMALSGELVEDVDFCEHAPASLAGFVYHDRDDDGRRERGEEGISGVLVRLLDADRNEVARQRTGRNGSYRFEGLEAGTYSVLETQPNDWIDGRDRVGTIGGLRVGTTRNDRLDDVQLLWGDEGVEYNFGEYKAASLRGLVQLSDRDGNCFGASENHEPLEGVLISLFNADGDLVSQTRTDASGHYSFEGLSPGTYSVFEHTPSQLIDAGARAGGTTSAVIGEVVDPNTIRAITLTSDQHLENYDFCEHKPATLKGTVYHDRNGNGRQDEGEEGIEAVVMQLIDEQGNVVAEAVTDAEGCYEFTGIRRGTYQLNEIHPEGWIDGIDSPGIIGGERSGVADNPGDRIREIDIGWGDRGTEFDFGEQLAGSITGRVHVDLVRDCVYDPEAGEEALSAVRVQLLDSAGNVVASTLTNADGVYRFTNVTPGVYSVRQIQPDQYFTDGQVEGSAGGDASVDNLISGFSVGSGQALTGYNFCELAPIEISGYVFQDGEVIPLAAGEELPDRLGDIRPGVRDAGDTPLAGVRLELRNGINGLPLDSSFHLPGAYAGDLIATLTDGLGFYHFGGIRPGTYAVYETQPEDYVDGVDTAGTAAGFVFNRGEPVPQFVTQTLAVDPANDAIVRINAAPGTRSVENNFSEVKVVPGVNPPPVIPDTPLSFESEIPTFVDVPVQRFAPPLRLYEFKPVGNISVGLRFHSWHLSVIDAGFPRGAGLASSESATIWLAAAERGGERIEDRLRDGIWHFGDDDEPAQEAATFGLVGAIPIKGDFNGDGYDEIGVYHRGHWYIDINANGDWDREDLWAKLGTHRDVPVTGDWDGDGKDDIGVFGRAWPGDSRAIAKEVGLPDSQNPPTEKPKNVPPDTDEATSGRRVMQRSAEGEARADLIDHVFRYGTPGDYPVVGDWNGDGISSIGVFRNGQWHLDIDGNGRWSKHDRTLGFGQEGDKPIVGDFNGDGVDDLAVLRDGILYVDANGNHKLDAGDRQIPVPTGAAPIAGDWNGDGVDEIATYRTGEQTAEHAAPPARKAG